jgi:haloalkane dehalogenase
MAIDWTFNGTWPYEPKWFASADGRMHYVDEGPRDGKPIVMVQRLETFAVPTYRVFQRRSRHQC